MRTQYFVKRICEHLNFPGFTAHSGHKKQEVSWPMVVFSRVACLPFMSGGGGACFS